ncbi:MAG: hypothetical protein KC561_05115 [Myxococcales bacterium]|nr:hypothetical protein [Myxococcales bacterium]
MKVFMIISLITLLPFTVAAQELEAQCSLGSSRSVSEEAAEQVTIELCELVGRSTLTSQTNRSYQVHVRSLGDWYWVGLSEHGSDGSVLRLREAQVSTLDEVPLASMRLVLALESDTSFEETATVSTLVGGETRPYEKLPGEILVGLGLNAVGVPGTGAGSAPGMAARVGYQTPRWDVGTDFRFALSEDLFFMDLSVGGRYFFSEASISPFVGGGVSWLIFEGGNSSETEETYVDGQGFATFVEAGVELFRLHSVRLTVDVRAHLPLFTAESASYTFDEDTYFYDNGTTEDSYYVPVTGAVMLQW